MKRLTLAAAVALLCGPLWASPDATVRTTHTVSVRRGEWAIQSGSGTVVGKTGGGFLVLSCAHVVEFEGRYGKGELVVTTRKGKDCKAKLLAWDAKRDLSLMEVTAKGADVEVALLADDEGYAKGEAVFKCGYPGGGRFRKGEGKILRLTETNDGYLNLLADAPSASGDSGGGVYRSSDGRLIGVLWGGREDGLRARRLPEIKSFLEWARK